MDDLRLVRVTVNLMEINLDRAFLSAASLQVSPSEAINQAIALHHVIMSAKPGQVIKWEFEDGSHGRVQRLT